MHYQGTAEKCLAISAILLLTVICAAHAEANIAGNIFTTDEQGSVNINLYNNKGDVWVNGGPRKEGAAGLPDGDYYIQVTSPNGVLLGSSIWMANPKPITVQGGEFVQPVRLIQVVGRASHPNHNAGYDDSPNQGNVYKVWVSMNSGFPNNESKTDNFKVRKGPPPGPQTTITVHKFYDASKDGIWDNGEPGIAGWRIELQTQGGAFIEMLETDAGGKVQWIVPMDNTVYKVVEIFPPEENENLPVWHASTDTCFFVTADTSEINIEFGNYALTFTEHWGLGRTIGFWQNQNGEALLAQCSDWWLGLNGLGLVQPNGDSFIINAANHQDAHQQLADWLVGNAALGNKKFILSRHFAALWLNVHCGPMSALASVWVNPNVEDLFDGTTELLDDPEADGTVIDEEITLYDDVNNNNRPVIEGDVDATPPDFTY
jgi:hypothetical protein